MLQKIVLEVLHLSQKFFGQVSVLLTDHILELFLQFLPEFLLLLIDFIKLFQAYFISCASLRALPILGSAFFGFLGSALGILSLIALFPFLARGLLPLFALAFQLFVDLLLSLDDIGQLKILFVAGASPLP